MAGRAHGRAGGGHARNAPKTARTTVAEWCATWLDGYGTRRPSTVRQARVHVAQIVAAFGPLPLATVRPSQVRAWCTKLAEQGYATSTVYALHSRLSQIMSDAVHDGILPRSPCSRRTSPPQAKQRPYVATTGQVWALHDAMPSELRPAVLLGAFAGLRVAEACGLRVSDVDFMRGVITPAVQYPAEPLKTEISQTPIPIARTLANTLAAHVGRTPGEHVLVGEAGESGWQCGPWVLERAVRAARPGVEGLPAGFRYHDLRHFYACLLIASGRTSRWYRPVSGTPRRAPRWTRTRICGPTATKPPGPPWKRSWWLVRTLCGLRR